MKLRRTPRRVLAPVAAAAAAALTGALVATTPAQSAPPAEDCAAPYPIADLTPDQPVHGLTVSKGTTPDPFTGQVIGVLDNGIAPGLDMVMVRLTSTEIDRVGGIWAGMSGSPVYAADGRLIGAVAYGLAYGPSPVAGVTPFEDMDDYLAAAPTKVRVPRADARSIAAATDVTATQAQQGFTELPLPLTVSGVSAARLANVKDRPYLDKTAHATSGSSAGVTAGPETLVAGGNLAFGAAYGEVSIAATGTVTSVCGGKVVGFGHPATFGGTVTAGLHPAEVLYVQEDSLEAPFKVSNMGAPVGTITDDHQTGVTGTFASVPVTGTVSSTVTYRTRSRTGVSEVEMPSYAASTVYYQVAGNHDRVVDGYFPGSEDESLVITGTGPASTPFTVDLSDRYVSSYGISDTASYETADLVYYLSQLPGVTVGSVTADGTVVDDANTWAVASLEYRAGGSWHKVAPRGRVLAKAGTTLRLRAVLSGTDEATRKVALSVDLPRSLSGTRGSLDLVGGGELYTSYWEAQSLKQFLKMARADVRNDSVVAQVWVDTGRRGTTRTVESSPTERVVQGSKGFRLVVR